MDGTNGNIIWNNFSGTTASNTISFTTGTTDTTDTNFSWVPVLDEDWLPYHYKAYNPKWHILLGYKTQMQLMWD